MLQRHKAVGQVCGFIASGAVDTELVAGKIDATKYQEVLEASQSVKKLKLI